MRTAVNYINELQSMLERIKTEEASSIQQAGALVADRLITGGIVHVFGSGHSHLIAEEAFFRAGGMVPVNPILDLRLLFLKGALESTKAEREVGYANEILQREDIKAGDAAILISNSGRNAVPIEMAMHLRERGVRIIVITNLHQSRRAVSRHASGKRLFEIAEIVIDNGAPEGDAVVLPKGSFYHMGPASTVLGAAIVNSVMITAAEEMLRRGVQPAVFPSANVDGTSQEALETVMLSFSQRIRYFRDSA
jgi:uncharacterized phosphosugar-binding protein